MGPIRALGVSVSVRLCLVGLGLAALVVRSGVPGRWLLAPGEAKQVKEGSPSGSSALEAKQREQEGFRAKAEASARRSIGGAGVRPGVHRDVVGEI